MPPQQRVRMARSRRRRPRDDHLYFRARRLKVRAFGVVMAFVPPLLPPHQAAQRPGA